MALKGISMPAVTAAGAGALVIWAALKGASIQGSFRSLLGGKQPSGANVNAIAGGISLTSMTAGPVVSASTDSAIANDALAYQGHPYRWGGASPVTGWDCSGMCNYVICHDMNMAVPGYKPGTFTGSLHGPPTSVWAVWPGAQTIARSQVQAGDLCIWPAFHMGIAISSSQMISAEDPQNGTQVSGIDGFASGALVCRRLG